MPSALTFDHAGNMRAIDIGADSVLSELYEHIGCKIVRPLRVTRGITLWVDAEGADNGQKLNNDLSKVVDILGGPDDIVYGPGVFLGSSESDQVLDLTRDDSEAIVMAQVLSARRQLRDLRDVRSSIRH